MQLDPDVARGVVRDPRRAERGEHVLEQPAPAPGRYAEIVQRVLDEQPVQVRLLEREGAVTGGRVRPGEPAEHSSALAAVPVALRTLVPEAVLDVSVAVLGLSVGCLAVWLWRAGTRSAIPALA